MPPKRGSFTPYLGILFTRNEACFRYPFFFPECAAPARQHATCASARQFTAVRLAPARDVMAAARVPRPSWTAPSGRVSPSCRIPTTRAAMTPLCALKANLAFRGVPHASTCALPVRNLRRALCEQNTLRRPHGASHTRPLGEPIRSESIIQPSFCPSRDRQHPPRAFTDRVSLAQPSTWRPCAQHGSNLALAAVQTGAVPYTATTVARPLSICHRLRRTLATSSHVPRRSHTTT